MNVEFIIGAILTIFFGTISIIQAYKGRPNRLIFVIDELINIYSDIVRNIDEIEVFYKGGKVTVKDNLYLIKVYLFYFGKKDILKNQIVKKLYIKLSDNSMYNDCKIINKTEELEVILYQENNKRVYFNFELLKDKDFIHFQFLCDLNLQKTSINEIFHLDHRIANIGKVITINTKSKRNLLYVSLVSWLITIIIGFFFIIPSIEIKESDQDYFANNIFYDKKDFDIDSLYKANNRQRDSLILISKSYNNKKIKLKDSLENYYSAINPKKNFIEYDYNNSIKLKKEIETIDSSSKEIIRLRFKLLSLSLRRIGALKKIDQVYKDFIQNYDYTFFLFADSSPFFELIHKYSVSFVLENKSAIYIPIIAILCGIILCIASGMVTFNYLKYISIVKQIALIRKKSREANIAGL
jgi:hypothetical protein